MSGPTPFSCAETLCFAGAARLKIDVLKIVVTEIAVRAGKLRNANIELIFKRKKKLPAQSPEEIDAVFPRRPRNAIKIFAAETHVVKDMSRQVGRGAFADADDTDFGAANDANRKLRHFALQGERGKQTSTASTKYDHRFEHRNH